MADPVVETKSGKVRGFVRGEVAIWRGIPYAAPPVGPLRFRPPEPPVAWAGERDATEFGDVAIQSRDPRTLTISGIPQKAVASEDCLVLNVFAPAERGDGKLPVMVWIHGGAFIMGAGSIALYDGGSFAKQGIVVVTINYRLGLPGFLYLGDLLPGRAQGNYGLLDQIAALRWVRDNIAAFGGDPGSVTLMGESAGAISIGTLLGMPAARGLFHRAILQSGAPELNPPSRDDAARVARMVLAELGASAEQLAELLAELPIDRVLAAQERHTAAHGLGGVSPCIDGATVPVPPIEAIRAGSADGVPLLLGSNRDEWTLFEVFLGEASVEAFKEPLRRRYGAALDPLVEAYRDRRPDRSLRRAWVDLVGDLAFGIPVIRLADAQAARAPVYAYRFDWESTGVGGRLGATHALELPFVWNRLDVPMAPALLGDSIAGAQALATTLHLSWAAFIKTGDPNGAGLPAWPRYNLERRPTLLLDREPRVAEDPAGKVRALWPVA
ncbi:MAG TPA: carboxylesterase/lipase family protein [Kofleriaceae bacterium]|nr:carboxylesterase/lipase family protein [Kofleriaceae bacterium]